jgi:hypothetical protein
MARAAGAVRPADPPGNLDGQLLDHRVIAAAVLTTMSNGDRTYSTYILNDRVGIYVIGYRSFPGSITSSIWRLPRCWA